MKVHEYQGKLLLGKYGVSVPNSEVLLQVDEAEETMEKLGAETVVVKAQIHAGGRGKGGGVKVTKSKEQTLEAIHDIWKMNLVTHQTGPEGKIVKRILLEEGIDIARELYAGIVLDRAKGQIAFMVSTEGGMEIEKVAAETPEKIFTIAIDPQIGFRRYHALRLADALKLSGSQVKSAVKFFQSIFHAYLETDASLVEINPLVVTKDGEIIALDAKMNFDDNALFRHQDIAELRDFSEEEESEVQASNFGLNYIKLDGNVGCMVNGAGLAMATMDIIKLNGGEPANFLDVGGVANSETVKHGFQIVMSDPNVKSILINIFGGIVRCDRVAQGVIDALQSTEISVPVIVRLEGTNANIAADLLNNSSLDFIVATSLQEAAKKAVQATIQEEKS